MTNKYGVDSQGRGLPPENFPPGREAPGDLEFLRRFVNTVNFESGSDRLETPRGLDAWLQVLGVKVDRATRPQWRRAVETRRALLALAECNRDGAPTDPATLAMLNGIGRRRPAVVTFDADGRTALKPADSTVDAWLGWLIGVLHDAMGSHIWHRLKPCRNHECRWLFFDSSRNSGGNWCTMKACGQRQKAKSYRHRQKSR